MTTQPAQLFNRQGESASQSDNIDEPAGYSNDSQTTLLDAAKESMTRQHSTNTDKQNVPYSSSTSSTPKSANIEITSEQGRDSHDEIQDTEHEQEQQDEHDGDVTVTADDGEEADHTADASGEADASKQSLSTDELVELRQFSEKKVSNDARTSCRHS